jgi:hypothetical protein
MRRIPAFRVALKDRPKAFQYIVFFLVTFSLLHTILNAFFLIQKDVITSHRTNSNDNSKSQKPTEILYSNVFSR